MKSLNYVLEYDDEDYTFELEPISDIHLDDINHEPQKLDHVIERIRTDKDRYTIGMGDYGSSIYSFPTEKRGTITIKQEYRDNPTQLYDDVYRKLFPIRDKIVGLVEGNHDHKIHQLGYHNWVKSLSDELTVPYLSYVALINMKFIHTPTKTETNYKIYATHGRYTGQEPSSAITKMKRLSSQIDGDIFLMGDRHDVDISKKNYLYVDDNGIVHEGTKIFALCGCFVKGYNLDNSDVSSFPERFMMYPNRTGTITVAIKPFHGKLNVHA